MSTIVDVDPSRFKISNAELREFMVDKEIAKLEAAGGIASIGQKLNTSLDKGLQESLSDIEQRQAHFGANKFEEPPPKNFFILLLNALREPILILLSVCAIVEIILGVTVKKDEEAGWIDGVAILIAVVLVSFVSAGTDYDKDRKFRALNTVKNDRKVKVKRNGEMCVIQIGEVQVGDVVLLDTGDWVPADGLFIEGHAVAVDESNMTGESDSVKKNKNKPFLLSGTQISEGSGSMLVIAVGMNSEWGITYSKLVVPAEETPLQESLGELAKKVGYIGTVVAVLVFIVLCIQFFVEYGFDIESEQAEEFLKFFTLSITIVVVAVPEGLPLAVTLSLAYSMKAMLKDNNLVRHLAACETMGGATNICSDKTGTLTENRMTVTSAWIGNKLFKDNLDSISSDVSKQVRDLFCHGIAVNSGAHLKFPSKENEKIEFIGSKTECALLVLAHKLGYNYVSLREEAKIIVIFPFSSEKKRMSTVVNEDEKARIYTKGASEIILGLCVDYIDSAGVRAPLTPDMQEDLKKTIESMASQGLRTLCLGYKDMDVSSVDVEAKDAPDSGLTLLAIVGIKDPLRPEVPDAIIKCKSAGITVRMVTGDNKLTATRIATDCGILSEGELVLEGPQFRELTDDQLDAVLPRLKVLARSSPSDKHRLVTRLKHHKEVVAVTGDGTNDGPALKAADVGFGMGIAGTEIAKEASDIIIMDDNFASIVQAVKWGRCVRGNIQKFLQFQLTVNLVALTVALVAAASGYGEPIRPIQFLWVNLIQDTLAALALATEKPTESLLDNKPAGRTERLITPVMWRNMVCIAVYQVAILFMILYAGHKIWNLPELSYAERSRPNVQYTILFNTFVFFQIFNEINARLLDNHWNAFKNLFGNWIFISIIGICTVLQILFIQFGGNALSTKGLDAGQWFSCLGLGASVLIVGVFVRVVIPVPQWRWLKYNTKISFLGVGQDAEELEEEVEELKEKEGSNV